MPRVPSWVTVARRSGAAEIQTTLHPGGATLKAALIRITIMKEVTSVKLRFIGQDGSMGLKFGEIYQASVETKRNGTTQMTRPVMCPYASDEAFARNWADPRVEIRTLMEARGKELRDIHIPDAQKESDAPLEEGMLEEQRIGEDA